MLTERDPSAAVFASLLLGVMSHAYGALIEMRDLGWALTAPACWRHLQTYKEAAAYAGRLFETLSERHEEMLADVDTLPIMEAIRNISAGCDHLARLMKTQVEEDAKFEEIAERLKQAGVGSSLFPEEGGN